MNLRLRVCFSIVYPTTHRRSGSSSSSSRRRRKRRRRRRRRKWKKTVELYDEIDEIFHTHPATRHPQLQNGAARRRFALMSFFCSETDEYPHSCIHHPPVEINAVLFSTPLAHVCLVVGILQDPWGILRDSFYPVRRCFVIRRHCTVTALFQSSF